MMPRARKPLPSIIRQQSSRIKRQQQWSNHIATLSSSSSSSLCHFSSSSSSNPQNKKKNSDSVGKKELKLDDNKDGCTSFFSPQLNPLNQMIERISTPYLSVLKSHHISSQSSYNNTNKNTKDLIRLNDKKTRNGNHDDLFIEKNNSPSSHYLTSSPPLMPFCSSFNSFAKYSFSYPSLMLTQTGQSTQTSLSLRSYSCWNKCQTSYNALSLRMNYTRSKNISIRFFTVRRHPSKTPTKETPPAQTTTKERFNSMIENMLFGLQKRTDIPAREKWRTSDLLSVWGVAALFTTIICMPFAYQHVKKADHEYDDFAMMPVDDIDQHVTSIFLEELKEELLNKRLFNLDDDDEDENDNNNDNTKSKPESRKLVRNTVIDLAKEILGDTTLHDALSDLLTRVIQSPKVQKAIQTLVKELWFDLISDPETKAQVVLLLQAVIQDEVIKKVIKELLLDLIQDEDVYRELMELIKNLGEESEVQAATQALLTESTHQALNDPEILDHSMEFATDVVGDDVVQRTSGEALRNTVSYAVQPGLSIMLSILGISLVTFSFTALKNARFTEREGAALNKAISNFGTRVGNVIARFFSRIWSAPRKILAPIGSAVSAIFMAPYELVKSVLSSISHAGGAIYQLFAGMFQAPVRIIEATTLAARHTFIAIGRTYLNASDSVQIFGNSMLQKVLIFTGNFKLSVSSKWQDLVSSGLVMFVGSTVSHMYSAGVTWISFIYSHFNNVNRDPR